MPSLLNLKPWQVWKSVRAFFWININKSFGIESWKEVRKEMKKQISLKLFFAFLLLSIFSILLFGCGNKDAFAGIGIVITERYKWSNVERPYQTVSKSNRINNKRGNIDLKYSAPIHYTVKIPANRPWIKTKIYLKKNDIVRIYCKGKVMPGAFEYRYKNTSCLAEGYHFTRSNFTVLPNANYMAAIGKIGNREDRQQGCLLHRQR